MSNCHPAKVENSDGDQLDRIVAAYLQTNAPKEERYLQYYRIQRSLPDAIEKAAMAELPGGKRFSHQRRIPQEVLKQVKHALMAQHDEIAECQTFENLFQLIGRATRLIHGVGPLLVYDTAHRLGAYLKLRPEVVYLHAGTRTGARALGLNHAAPKLPRSAFPKAFWRLLPEQIEDCLCIYKQQLQKMKFTPPARPSAPPVILAKPPKVPKHYMFDPWKGNIPKRRSTNLEQPDLFTSG